MGDFQGHPFRGNQWTEGISSYSEAAGNWTPEMLKDVGEADLTLLGLGISLDRKTGKWWDPKVDRDAFDPDTGEYPDPMRHGRVVEFIDDLSQEDREKFYQAHALLERFTVEHDDNYYERARTDLADGWKQSSTSHGSQQLKEAVAEEFGGDKKAIYNPSGFKSDDQLQMNTDRAVLARMYRETQEDLKDIRVQNAYPGVFHTTFAADGSATLYRGVSGGAVLSGSIASWTSDVQVARDFAGGGKNVVMTATVSPSRILTYYGSRTWRSKGYGAGQAEAEYIVMEGKWNPKDRDPGAFRIIPTPKRNRSNE
jgi:hypothetical protein